VIEGQLALAMFVVVCGVLLLGFPVALTLGGTALGFAALGILLGHFDPDYLSALTARIFGTMGNETLVAVPLFILMGVVLERARIAEDLLANMAGLFGARPGGLGVAVIVVGALLAASTGIVGATVVTMGVLALPTMLKAGYSPQLAAGTICATGTLGHIIPPSIALVLLGDIMSSAYQQAQLRMNIINTDTVSVGDLFVGAMVPGVLLVMLYLGYLLLRALLQPGSAPPAAVDKTDVRSAALAVLPPLGLIMLVLGSILIGAATPTEAAGVGATGALLLALCRGALSLNVLQDISRSTLYTTSMVFLILIGAAVFSLVFRGFGGDAMIESFFEELTAGRNVGDVFAGIHSRFHRDHLCSRPGGRSYLISHGFRPDLAGGHDRSESSNLVPDASLRLCPVLPPRSGARECEYPGDLFGCFAFRAHPAPAASVDVVVAQFGAMATGRLGAIMA